MVTLENNRYQGKTVNKHYLAVSLGAIINIIVTGRSSINMVKFYYIHPKFDYYLEVALCY